MEKGKLYGLGVGPGDPELVTMKAVRLLRDSDVIAVPDKGSGEKTALKIVETYVQGKELLYCATPMIRDKNQIDLGYEKIANEICALLDEGKNVAFITLGDPTVYSTYMYVHKKVLDKGYEAQLVPGVPSFCAVAARLGESLCERSERLLIVPASCDVQDTLDVKANKVFMKAGSSILTLKEQLREAGMLENASLVENCGMESERVWQRFEDMTQSSGYYSIVLVKEPN